MGEHHRWSDEELDKFHTEFTEKAAEGEQLFFQLQAQAEANAAAVRRIEANTKGLLNLWKEGGAIIKVGATLGRFASWLSGLAVIGVMFKWLLDNNT
jgi:hypothetical protein